MRALWSGEIAFGLVSIPVKLYAATRDLTPSFHYLHAVCGTRITNVRRCPHCNVDVPWDQVAKGHEVEKGRYALFTKEELAALEGEESASGIDIAEFVDPTEIEVASVEKSYWVGPGGRSTKSYELLREVLTQAKKVAIARVKIRTRTRLAMLRPREGRFSLDMLRFGDEMVPAKEIEIEEKQGKGAAPREQQLAKHLVEHMSGRYDPTKHPDEYRAAVVAAVEQKVEAGELAEEQETEREEAGAGRGGKVIDLAELLRRSLGAPKSKGAAAEETKRAPKRAAEGRRGPTKASPRAHATTKRRRAAGRRPITS